MKRKLQMMMAAFTLMACTAHAQTLTITGVIQDAPGPVEVTISYLDGFLFSEVANVMTDEYGVFTYTDDTVEATGQFMVSFQCGGMIVSENGTWNEDLMTFAFTLTYCGGGSECYAYYYFVDSLENSLFNVTVVNASTGNNLTYLWDFGDGGTSDEMNPTYYYAATGSYLLCLTVSDGEGCTSTYCDSLTVNEDGTWEGGEGAPIGFTLNVITEEELNAVAENPLPFVGVNLFPNPVKETSTLTIETKQAFTATVECSDLRGRKISAYSIALAKGKNVLPLDVAQLAAGNYFVKVSDETGNAQVFKLVK